MSESPIQHVTDTAFWVATYRAVESERPDALFRDPLAARLVEGRGRAIAGQMIDAKAAEWAVVIRTCVIDDYIREAIAGGCDTIINLGAGLDTRPYRMELPPSLKWFEVDFPATIEFKEKQLGDERARCSLERVGLDLRDAVARRELLERMASGAKSALVLTEGVVPYLSCDETAALAADLLAQPTFNFWVLDYFSPQLLALRDRSKRSEQMARAPFKFRPDDWNGFFAERGWLVKEMRYLGDVGRRLGRPAPLPWWVRLIMPLLSKRKAIRRLTGYAILRKH